MKVKSKQTNSKMCIVCGIENKNGVMANFYNMEDNSVGSIFSFKETHQSYPGRVHGGMISALLDEIAGRTLWVENPELLAVTSSMTVKFRKPVPYNQQLYGRGEMLSKNGRYFTSISKIFDENKNLLAECEANYVILPKEKIASENSLRKEDISIFIKDSITNIEF